MASVCKRCRHPRAEWDSCGCQWLIRQERHGKTIYAKAGSTRAEAERNLRRLKGLNEETVNEAIDIWLAAKRLNPDARVGSLLAYESRAKLVRKRFGHQPVRDVRPEEVAAFSRALLESGRAPSTCRSIYAVLSAVLRHAAARGVIHQLPLPPSGSGLPTPAGRSHDISIPDLVMVIRRMPEQWGLLAELCLLTGLRIGEALALTPEVVGPEVLHVRATRNGRGTVNRPKTRSSERLIPLDERSQEILEALHLPVALSYCQARRALNDALGPLKRRGMSWHVFRHAHASLLNQDGANIREVAARLGHGHNYAMSLSYSLRAEAAGPRDLGALLRQHEPSEPVEADPRVLSLDEARARRAARGRREDP